MAVQLNITYETLLTLIEQLPPEQQRDLAQRLQAHTQQHDLPADAWMKLLREAQIDAPIGEEPSPRRADWYD